MAAMGDGWGTGLGDGRDFNDGRDGSRAADGAMGGMADRPSSHSLTALSAGNFPTM